MIQLLFILTILSGVIQEFNSILKNPTPKAISIMYAFGSIFFLFWQEPYILYFCFIFLNLFSIVDFVAELKKQERIRVINTWVCLFLLVMLAVNWAISL